METEKQTNNKNSKSGPEGQIDNGNPGGGGENIPQRTRFFNLDSGRIFLHDDIIPNVKLVTESRG